jgi:transcriptional regulator with GAF, ATPase, and Fis domain
VKGTFTGAAGDRAGHFESASGGTLFLDEVGELAPEHQVGLLRVLQEKKVRRIGGSKEIPVDVRIIAATNRDLLRDVAAGRFREDLYYRLAILVLHPPAVREREGDLGLLADHFLERLNDGAPVGTTRKKLSPRARNLVLRHDWPGNVRELEATLWRAFVWTAGPVIEEKDLRDALFARPQGDDPDVLERPIGPGFDLEKTLGEVARHYLGRALAQTGNNRTQAAQLVGFKSYQRLSDWLRKYGVA